MTSASNHPIKTDVQTIKVDLFSLSSVLMKSCQNTGRLVVHSSRMLMLVWNKCLNKPFEELFKLKDRASRSRFVCWLVGWSVSAIFEQLLTLRNLYERTRIFRHHPRQKRNSPKEPQKYEQKEKK